MRRALWAFKTARVQSWPPMGTSAELPREVRAFVERHLVTGAQAEVLLLVHGDADRVWQASTVGRELRIDERQAEHLLDRFVSSGVLRRETDGYRYEPRTRKLAEVAGDFVALYPTYRVAIISLIFSKPSGSIRDFSDAFRLRDED